MADQQSINCHGTHSSPVRSLVVPHIDTADPGGPSGTLIFDDTVDRIVYQPSTVTLNPYQLASLNELAATTSSAVASTAIPSLANSGANLIGYDDPSGTLSANNVRDALVALAAGSGGSSSALDDITVGDAASTLATSAGNITIDARGGDTDIIFKGTDDTTDITMLTLDGSAAGAATFNSSVTTTSLILGSTAVTSTAAELNLLDGVSGLVQADFTKLAAVTSSAAELNLLDGVSAIGDITSVVAGTGLTGGATSGDATLNVIGGTGITANANDIAVDASQTQITAVGALDAGSITSNFGTIDTGSSAITTTGLISGGSLDIDHVLINGTTIGHTDDTDLMTVADGLLTVAGEISVTTLDIGGTNVTSTAAELNILDGVTSTYAELNLVDGSAAGTIANSKAVIYGGSGQVNATTLQIAGASITSTAAELNLLDGVSGLVQADFTKLAAVDSTAAELNIVDGGTGASAVTLADADRVVVNDDGTMKQVALSDFETYMETSLDTLSNVTSLGTLTTLTVDDITVNGNTISSNGSSTLAITPKAGQTITFDGTVTLDAGVIAGATSITSTAFVGDITGDVTGDCSGTAATVTGGTQAAITTAANLVTVGALDSGSITSGFGTIDTGSSAITTTGALTGGSLACTAAATFGGGYGSTGATISTAGVGQFNGALTTDGLLTCSSLEISSGVDLLMVASSADEVALTIQGADGQTANIMEWKNPAGSVVLQVLADGSLKGANLELSSDGAAAEGVPRMGQMASTANAKGASLIGVEDSAGNITATTVEAALAEHAAIIGGVTSTPAELNILDGVTSTAAELNILDGVTSTAAELNLLDGVTSIPSATWSKYISYVEQHIRWSGSSSATSNPGVSNSTNKARAAAGLNFSDEQGYGHTWQFVVPPELDVSQIVTATVYARTGSAGSGNVEIEWEGAGTADDEWMGSGASTSGAVVFDISGYANNDLVAIPLGTMWSGGALVVGDFLHVTVFRDATEENEEDTFAGTVQYFGIELRGTRKAAV